MKKLIIGLVLLVWPFGSCIAESRTVTGAGNISCSGWLDFREENSLPVKSTTSWILGALSSLNLAKVMGPTDFLKNADMLEIVLWMDKYCKEHPASKISDATETLAIELYKRAEK
jgi:hypothetical protein